jgi:hypothetical protein
MDKSAVVETIRVHDFATPDEVRAIAGVFKRTGFDVEVSPTAMRRSEPWAVPWVIEVVLLVHVAAFFQTLASEAAKDAYPLLKEWVKDVWAAARTAVGSEGGVGELELFDSEETRLLLAEDLRDEAIEALADLGRAPHWLAPLGRPRETLARLAARGALARSRLRFAAVQTPVQRRAPLARALRVSSLFAGSLQLPGLDSNQQPSG